MMDIELLGTDELKRYMRDGKVYLVDVREKDEFNEGHIKGSVNIPVSEMEAVEDCGYIFRNEFEDVVRKGYKIVLYCKSGNRSMRCARMLKDCGIPCASLYGGIEEFVIDE